MNTIIYLLALLGAYTVCATLRASVLAFSRARTNNPVRWEIGVMGGHVVLTIALNPARVTQLGLTPLQAQLLGNELMLKYKEITGGK